MDIANSDRINRFRISSFRLPLLLLTSIFISFTYRTPTTAAQLLETPADRVSKSIQQEQDAKKPYRLSSRIHLQEGSTKGYLVVKVELDEGMFVYSLTQKGSVPPTKLTVGKTSLFKLTGKFSPDTPAKKTAKDPWLGHAVEKHSKLVQFFAPIELASGIDAKKLKADISFDGQICGSSSCLPLEEKISAKFAGYFTKPAAKKAIPQARSASRGGGTNREF